MARPAGAAPRTSYQQSQIDLQNQIIKEHPEIGQENSPANQKFVRLHQAAPDTDLRDIAASMYPPATPSNAPAPDADSPSTAYKVGALIRSFPEGVAKGAVSLGNNLGEALYNAYAGFTGNTEAATGRVEAPSKAQVDLAKDKARGNAKPYNDQAIQWYKDHNRPLPARYAEIQDRYATQPPPPPPTTDEVHAKGVPPESAPAKVPEGPGPDSPNWKDSVLAPNANKVPYASTEDSNSGTYAALRASTTTPPAPSASPTAFDPAGLPGLPSKAAQRAAALTGKPSEGGPGIVAQPHPTAGPLASPASPPAAASSARTTAPGALPGASAADQAPRAVEASVAAKPAPADQPAATSSGRNDSGNAISAAPMPGDARPDPHPSNVGQMRSGPNVGTNQNPLTQDALDDARSQLANRAINHQDFYNLTGRVDAHAAPSARNAAMSDLDSLHQSTAGNAASSTGAPQPQTPGGSMAGTTAVGRNDALSNAVTPGAGADSLTAQTTPGKIQYGGPTSNSDWARMFAPTPVADWSKIGSNHQVAAADSPAAAPAPGPDDEDEKLKQLRAGTADPAAGGDNTTQSPAAQTQDIA